jgi:fucose permease
MLGPVLMTAFVERSSGWRVGYAVLAAILGVLAVAFAFNVAVWSSPKVLRDEPRPPHASSRGHRGSIALGVLLFFVYSGVEASCGQWAFTYLTEGLGFGPRGAGLAVSGYYGALGLGRVVFGLAAHRTAAPRLIRIGAAAALASGLVLSVARGPAAVAALLVMGLALAPIYPLAIAETPRRVGAAWADRAVGWQVSSAYLGFVWPSLGGVLASRVEVAALGPYFAALAVLLMLATEAVLRGPHADEGSGRDGH